MTTRRMLAIVIIFLTCSAGWWILGTATAVRSHQFSGKLYEEVAQLWGVPLVQPAPTLAALIPGTDQVRWLMPQATTIRVSIDAKPRKKGLLWYPTYSVEFDGTYRIFNPEDVTQKIRLGFAFPAPDATYDQFGFTIDDQPLETPVNTREGIAEILELGAKQTRKFRITYKTRGMTDWRYAFDPRTGRVRNLDLTLLTNFKAIDYTGDSLSPMSVDDADINKGGLMVQWQADDLITRQKIGVIVPEKLNPGPLTTRITFFAPVCLIFFFVLIAAIQIMCRINIHPMHYLFTAAGFFAFHLLLSYMAGLVAIHLAFIISAMVSIALVTAYLSAALGKGFPWKIAAAGQVFFLVLFSYSFFFKGITGLTVAIGSVVTLGILMKITAHLDWNDVFDNRLKTPA